MRLASLLVASLALAVHLTQAAPLAGSLEDVVRGFTFARARESIPTTSEVDAARDLAAPSIPPVPAHDGVGSPHGSPFESGSLPDLLMSPGQGPVHSLAAQIARELSFSPRIDALFLSFSPLYRQVTARFKLPQEIVHIPSPWLKDVYTHMLSVPSDRRKPVFNHEELPIPASIVSSFESNEKHFHFSRVDAYLLRISPEWLGVSHASVPLELLVRFHKEMHWYQQPVRNVISFWSSADGASKLALLGTFRITKHGFENMIRGFPGVERFALETRVETSPVVHTDLFLVRKRLPGTTS
ncbi:hypothetical protein PSEUBRA_004048 [Kalmanozyma brasiliensis GHG001]|uniref:uncharacterized protein n=1 Tax=Kalmanozyma brasiliensis (strain GHG001) TaxID=1365824 RepID=UPI002868306F|nr:uncharacterized protein PSEUBRA_004048 [Kalmanozyma brasiliensis GHG001]KAF6767333.1 hypothetical protein PSEUBRA_004048 [Kalmanozyma brasiliensis GHG001]